MNIVATYGRSLYALVLGLFTARWVLQALGEIDYGLYGVVGGLAMFVAFFNGVLSVSVGRFYAVSVGMAGIKGCEGSGIKECKRWFTVATFLHLFVAILLVSIGYPIGEWAVRNWLTIPAERISDCVWVWRFVSLTCFVSMASVPFNGMYTAKQYIAELTIYSVISTTLNVGFVYYMITHPGVWLVKYACWLMLLSLIPSIIIAIRAVCIFKECRIDRMYIFHWPSIRKLMSFSGWNLFGSMGNLLKGAGMTILVNKMLGPARNAAVTIANNVSGHAQTLSGSFVGALMPAITNAYGAGDRTRMIHLVHLTCKFGAILLLPVIIPLFLEIDEVVRIWLKPPPAGVSELTCYIFIVTLFEKLTTGHWVVIAANGKIALYQFLVGICFIASVPLAGVLIWCGMDISAVGVGLLVTILIVVVIRIIAVKLLLGISSSYWITKIFMPILCIMAITLLIGAIPRMLMPASLLRVCVTGAVCELILMPMIWLALLTKDERIYIIKKIKARI